MKSPKPKKEQPQQAADLPARIRPELNIEKWSIWQPANSRTAPKPRVLEREVELPNGSRVIAKVEVSPTTRGNLTTEDQKVYYALNKQWEERGRCRSFTPFSSQRLAKILGKPWGKRTRESLDASLARLRGTLFIWENSYEDKATGRTLSRLEFFNLLSDLKIVRTKDDGVVNKEVGYFRFHDAILNNLLANHTKPLLFEVVLSFKSEIAQILYTHLDLILSDKTVYERRTKELFEDLGLEGKSYVHQSKRKQMLELALKELQGKLVTTGRITTAKLQSTKDGADYKLVVRKGQATSKAAAVEAPESRADVILPPVPAQDQPTDQAEELVRDFHRVFHGAEVALPTAKALDQAARLIARLGFERARHLIDFARREAPRTRHQVATFGGILQYATPALHDFERTEQDRERQRRAEATREAERRREADARAREEAEEAEFNRHWESLSPAQREAFTADALAHAERYYLGFQSRRYRQQADPTSPSAVASLRTILRAHFQAWHTPAGPTSAVE